MGLLKKLFGGKHPDPAPATAPGSPDPSQFQESDTGEPSGPRVSAPRRELVQVVLRDTMRQHGIPSDWIDCRILSVATRRKVSGMHVQLVVRQGHDQLLTYVYPFQENFFREIEKFDPRAREWILSIAWQFEGTGTLASAMPDPSTWAAAGGAAAGAAPVAPVAPVAPEPEDELAADLKALFAIRDAAFQDDASQDPPDFQPTQPGFMDSTSPKR
jgi:hypothetical protein